MAEPRFSVRLFGMVAIRAFAWTLAAFFAATCVSWANRLWLTELWLAPVGDIAPFTGVGLDVGPSLVWLFVRVTVVTALLLTLPVFSAEVWLVICRLARRDEARRLAIPFSVVSTAGALVALWFVRQFEFAYLVGFL